MTTPAENLSIIVVGASGDLARRKIFPALFALYCQDALPASFRILGFARSEYGDDDFRRRITEHLTCRYAPGESCAERMETFLARCHYVAGKYDSRESFLDLYQVMQQHERGVPTPRLVYLAIPPSIFLDVAHALGGAGLVSCDPGLPWSRVVIEKPFGRDRESSDILTREMGKVFREPDTYRIDHYLGKEIVQNLLVLRFANLVFEPIWNRNYIKDITISWEEDLDIQGRGGYFDHYGIIRDVIQNHMLQIMSLIAMEPPASMSARAIRDEKVQALRCVPPLTLDDVVIGQYTAATHGGREVAGYTGDPSVPDDSITPTFAAARLRVNSRRWAGVPFIIRAGKGMGRHINDIRIRFHDVPANMFCDVGGCPAANELVIRVQPDEAITLRIANKVPGMAMRVAARNLDLQYKSAFQEAVPDAYESLLLDVIEGDKTLFIHGDELEAAWDIFTPVLHKIDDKRIKPDPYPFGSDGPESAKRLMET